MSNRPNFGPPAPAGLAYASHGFGHQPPPVSEVPAAEEAPSADEVVPHPAADVGGLSNIPEELLSASERAVDELDHAGLDSELPGEDRAPVSGPPSVTGHESW